MININSKYENIIIYIIFSIIFITGINIYQDYGLSLDDESYRKNGEISYTYIKRFFLDKSLLAFNSLESINANAVSESGFGSIVNHPVLFELMLAFFVDVFNFNQSKEIFEFSHLLNFIIFFIGLVYFFLFIKHKFQSKYYALFAVTILFLSPRIFAESFYNSRDIFFLSLFLIYIYATNNFVKNQTIRSSIYFSLSSALLINAKILGIVPPVMFLFFYLLSGSSKNTFSKKLKRTLYVVPLILFFMYLFWPYLWNDPISNLYNAFVLLPKMHGGVELLNLYLGDFISSNNTQWHYRIVWFFSTTPIIVLLFFVIGFCFLIFQIFTNLINLTEKNDNLWLNEDQMFNFYLITTLLAVLIGTIQFNESKFGGWRHLYFLYPIVVTITLLGYRHIYSLIKGTKFMVALFLIIGINFLYIIHWNYKYHPYQYVFFNFPSKFYANNNFDLDYWGVSNSESLKYILKNNNNFPIKIGTVSFSSLKTASLILSNLDKKNLNFVGNLEEADFLITNYMKRFRKNFEISEENYIKYFEIVVDDMPINTVYKKIN